MDDEQHAQLQREMGQAFYADVCKLEDENKDLRAALERERSRSYAELQTLTARFDEQTAELLLARTQLEGTRATHEEQLQRLRIERDEAFGVRGAIEKERLRLVARTVELEEQLCEAAVEQEEFPERLERQHRIIQRLRDELSRLHRARFLSKDRARRLREQMRKRAELRATGDHDERRAISSEMGAYIRYLNEVADAIGVYHAIHFSDLPAAVRAAVQRGAGDEQAKETEQGGVRQVAGTTDREDRGRGEEPG